MDWNSCGESETIKIISHPKEFRWIFLQFLNTQKEIILKKHSKYIKSPNIEIIGGIVLGDEAVKPPEEVKTSFIHSGLYHMLAASGMNVALIFGISFFILRKLRVNYAISIVIGMFLVLIYSCMTGFPPSLVRATIMLEFVLLGKLINRKANTFALLFLAGLILLLYN